MTLLTHPLNSRVYTPTVYWHRVGGCRDFLYTADPVITYQGVSSFEGVLFAGENRI
jgi:hypothetical protein